MRYKNLSVRCTGPYNCFQRQRRCQFPEIRHTYDYWGNHVGTIDAMNRVVESLRHDLLGRIVQKTCMDSASEWSFLACDGQLVRHWNSRLISTHYTYNALRRITIESAFEGHASEKTVHLVRYGEGAHDDMQNNLRGPVFQQFDQSGLKTYVSYDMDSNCLLQQLQPVIDVKWTIDWKADQVLEDETYVTSEVFDAFGRTISCRNARGATTRYDYNRTGGITIVSRRPEDLSEWFLYVKHTEPDAEGAIFQIDCGNGVKTDLRYNPLTRLLVNKQTIRANGSPRVLQDLSFTYDIEHRIIIFSDAARSDVFFRNAQVTADREFRYSAIGELLEGRGRDFMSTIDGDACVCSPYSPNSPCSQELLLANSAQLCRYLEMYTNDKAENLTSMLHELIDGTRMDPRVHF
jgi:hypothetical protein